MRKAALAILALAALLLLAAATVSFLPALRTLRPTSLFFGALTFACFALSIWASAKASPLLSKPGLITPSQLIALGKKHGRLYSIAGYSSYAQILFIGLAILL